MRSPLACTMLFAASLAACPDARCAEGTAPVLTPGRLLAPVVSHAGEASPTLGFLLREVARLEGSHLSVEQRPQPDSSMRAHSRLSCAKEGGFRVEGTVFLPPAVSRIETAALLAHELAHVLAMAGSVARWQGDPKDERLAKSFEDAVRRELRDRAVAR